MNRCSAAAALWQLVLRVQLLDGPTGYVVVNLLMTKALLLLQICNEFMALEGIDRYALLKFMRTWLYKCYDRRIGFHRGQVRNTMMIYKVSILICRSIWSFGIVCAKRHLRIEISLKLQNYVDH
jgi:hypothetical protein